MAKIERRTLFAERVDLIAKSGGSAQTVSINIPRDKFIRRMELRQFGKMDISTVGSLVPAAAPSVISKIRLIRDGSETLASFDP